MNVDSVMWSKWGQTKSDVLKPPKTKVFNNIERSFDSRQVHLGGLVQQWWRAKAKRMSSKR